VLGGITLVHSVWGDMAGLYSSTRLIGFGSGDLASNRESADTWDMTMLKTSEDKEASLHVSCIVARRIVGDTWIDRCKQRTSAPTLCRHGEICRGNDLWPAVKAISHKRISQRGHSVQFQCRNSSVLAALRGDTDACKSTMTKEILSLSPESLKHTIASECRRTWNPYRT